MSNQRLVAFGLMAALALPGGSLLRGCTPPPPPPPAPIVAIIEPTCVDIANAERAKAGVGPLAIYSGIEYVAGVHSVYQATKQRMTHNGSGGTSAGQRLNGIGYKWSTWGENVAAGQGDCASVMAAWMASSGHRANILNSQFLQIGVASAVGKNGVRYWTMILARPG